MIKTTLNVQTVLEAHLVAKIEDYAQQKGITGAQIGSVLSAVLESLFAEREAASPGSQAAPAASQPTS